MADLYLKEIRSFIKCKFFQYGPRSEHKSSPYKTHSRNRSTTQLSSYEHGAKISAQVHGERVKDENSDRVCLAAILQGTKPELNCTLGFTSLGAELNKYNS